MRRRRCSEGNRLRKLAELHSIMGRATVGTPQERKLAHQSAIRAWRDETKFRKQFSPRSAAKPVLLARQPLKECYNPPYGITRLAADDHDVCYCSAYRSVFIAGVPFACSDIPDKISKISGTLP